MSVTKLIYILYGIGLFLWQFPLFYRIYTAFRGRFFIIRSLRQYTDLREIKKLSPAQMHIKMLIEGAGAEKIFPFPETFFAVSLLTGLGVMFIVSLVESPPMAFVSGMFMGAVPYCLLNLRLFNQRVVRSREGDLLVQELLNNYKIYDYNMKEAVEVTAGALEGAPEGRRLLFQLSRGFNSAVTRTEVEHLLSVFRYSIDTAWGNALASNIFFAHVFGIRVDAALEDLLATMSRSRQVVEHGRRENNEARLILKYLAPVSFLLSVACACHFFGFTLAKYMKYQFETEAGLKSFLIMGMLYGAGLLINGFFSREKMDI